MSNEAYPREDDGYTVTHCKYGIAVFGGVPLSEMSGLIEHWSDEYDLDQMRADIAHAIDANFVLTSEAKAEEWCEAIEEVLEQRYADPLTRWRYGLDAGQSSLTIYHVLKGVPLTAVSRTGHPSEPADASDFGRCVRLLEIAPDEWRERLNEVADTYEEWRPIVEHWDELESLHGKDPEALTERLRELRHGEGA